MNGEGWILSPNRGRWVKLQNTEKRGILEYYDLTMNEAGELAGHGDVSFSGYDAQEIRALIITKERSASVKKKSKISVMLSSQI